MLPLLLSACELSELTVVPGEPVVVVQSVISRTRALQFAVVEHSLTGETAAQSSRLPRRPRAPITGARVTIAHLGPSACMGRVDTLVENPPQKSGPPVPGFYGNEICTPEPGAVLSLRVETPSGEVVTGRTIVPGARARDVAVAGRTARYPSDTLLLNRDRDTLRIGVTALSGRALQIEASDQDGPLVGDPVGEPALFLFIDTLGLKLAGKTTNLFEPDRTVFRGGRHYELTVALTDTNYYDFVRSRSDPFTGRGFINRLTGGVGVFGGVETVSYFLRVVADVDDPREGVYRVTGSLGGVNADLTIELYLGDVSPQFFAAFVEGQWIEGAIHTAGDGSFGSAAIGEQPEPGRLLFSFYGPPGDTLPRTRYTLIGVRTDDGSPFAVVVRWFTFPGRPGSDTLAMQQISGPPRGPNSAIFNNLPR